uniref:Fibronectin type-III domain-containing protein n=1 Tax=Amphimedon queenslandica TaxID=400682 RepID=A0A1X7UTW5_AMPQE
MLNLIFLLLLHSRLQYIDCANITLQPVSINTTLNSTVVFSCEATADALSFRVNNLPDSNTDVTAKGFSVTSSGTGTIRAELEAIAYEHNNNTEINCTAITLSPLRAVTSNTVVLTIQGLLDSVVDLDYTFINGSSVLLTWTAPYTLDNVPITGYYIVNGLVNITTTNKSIILSATNPDPCILNNVSVSSINDVGIGSSNNISFYYEAVPLITPPVSVVPVIDGQQILLKINISVSTLCKGEYPNSITVIILNTDNAVIKNTSIPTQFNDQLMILTGSTSISNLNTFTVNVSLSNNGGTFGNMSSTFGFLGPVTNIDSSIDNCSTIDITWTAPTVDDRVPILYYILRIYDAITGRLMNTASVILECTGEAPEHVTVTVTCNRTNSSITFLIEPKNDFTDLLPVPQYQECTINIVFSNSVGSSEGFSLEFDAYPPNVTTTCACTTETSPTTTPVSTHSNTSTGSASLEQGKVPLTTTPNEAHQLSRIPTKDNVAYGEIHIGPASLGASNL